MGIICGARKSFIELSPHITISAEAFDSQQELGTAARKQAAPCNLETKSSFNDLANLTTN
jgi:hypothetical protein